MAGLDASEHFLSSSPLMSRPRPGLRFISVHLVRKHLDRQKVNAVDHFQRGNDLVSLNALLFAALCGKHVRLWLQHLDPEYICSCSQMFGPIISSVLDFCAHLSNVFDMGLISTRKSLRSSLPAML